MPKLWNETIEAHRRAVRDATLDATAQLVAAHGLSSVTMSAIAQRTGIGRATLYKYFPDVPSILTAWHERLVAGHLEHLTAARGHGGDAGQQLRAVLETYAADIRHQHDGDLAALLHQGEHVARAQHQLAGFLGDLIAEGAKAGQLRDDVPATELAAYCLHALGAAGAAPSKAAIHRLVDVTLAGLRPAHPSTHD